MPRLQCLLRALSGRPDGDHIHHRMPLAAFDVLARIIAAWAAAFRGLDALAVDHCGRRAGVAPSALAAVHEQMVVHALEDPAITQPGEPSIDATPRRAALRQHAPGTADAQDVENGVDDLALRPGPASALPTWPGQPWFQQTPIGIGQVTRIAQARTAMLPSGGRGPLRKFHHRCRNPLESRLPAAIHPQTRS